jgi:hypothetical protein
VTADVVDMLTGYVRAGIGVFPLHGVRGGVCTCGRPAGKGPGACHSPAKHPLLGLAHWRKDDPLRESCRGECGREGHGVHDASTDLGQVAEWLARFPGCNWAIRPPLGVLVLDVDPRNGGDTELARLEAKHGKLPATLTARTGSGGTHHWLSYSGPTRGRLCTGVDVKTHSGYLVAPPSVHMAGGTYEWIDQAPAAYAPQWVKDVMNPPVRRRPTPTGPASGKARQALVQFVATRPYGQINDGLYWAACRAAERGILDDLVEDLLAAAAHAAGGEASAAGAAQSRRTIESARRRPAAVRSSAATDAFLTGRSA